MFPAQTSLIPIHIALARFIENQGWQAIFNFYPYWYLDSTPFRYLTGPILPLTLVFFHKLLPGLSLFEVFLGLIGLCLPVGATGIYLLVREWKGSRLSASLAAIFYLFGPFVPLLFRFADGLHLITLSFLPFILMMYLRLLKKWRRRQAICLSFAITGLLLLETTIIPSLIMAMAAVLLAQTGWKRVENKIRQTLAVIFFALLMVTFWYTPDYWLTLLTAPSLGGKTVWSIAVSLPRLLAIFLSLFIAVFTKRLVKQNSFRGFCFFWLFIFGFLTLTRLIADPDFWLDWISYSIEIQMGIAITLSYLLARIKGRYWQSWAIGFFVVIFLTGWFCLFRSEVVNSLQNNIEESVEYRTGKELSKVVGSDEKVFLSGTTVFWLNAFFDISQVRGGVDQAAVHSTWDRAAWEIREGTDVEQSERWLRNLGVSYILVHNQASREFYHDFRYPDKFKQGNFQAIYSSNGDTIYKLIK